MNNSLVNMLSMVPTIISPGVGMYILNTEFFGFIMPNKKNTNINEASDDFFQFKINTLG